MNDPKETKQECENDDNSLRNSSHTAEITNEKQKNQPLLSDAEQLVLEVSERPVDVRLRPVNSFISTADPSHMQEDVIKNSECSRGFLRMTCLNPNFSLRTQLMLTFGSVSAFIISFVLIVSVIIAWYSSENLKSINQDNFQVRVREVNGKVTRYLSESLTPKLIPEHLVKILSESVRDRFAGYPNDDDEFVPFFDIDSRTNKYPVVGVTGTSLPLDWQINGNVNDNNHEEHVQGRWPWYDTEPVISTTNANYVMQGICDPSVTDPSALTYWENCTEANNDISTGGVINPSPTNLLIYRKASSLSPIIKAVYEGHQDIRELGIYFANSGVGAALNFPHYLLKTNVSYTSIGCEWMNNPNPYEPSRPIGTKEEIARCRPEGTTVSSRIYNNLERDWCRKQAMNPFEPMVDGPFLSAWNEGQLLMSIGQAVYDRVTDNFIACTDIGFGLENIQTVLTSSKVIPNSELSVARFDDGTTVTSTNWNPSNATKTVKIYDIDVGLTTDLYDQLKFLVDFNTTWDPKKVRKKYETFALRNDGFLITAYPMPPVPELYDPTYIPHFFVIMSTLEKDTFQVVSDVKANIDDHLHKVIFISWLVGATGLAIVLLIVYFMSKTLTAPLEYMNAEADKIIDCFGRTGSLKETSDSNSLTLGYRCSPRTELDDVVEEFDNLITSFSGCFTSGAKYVKVEQEEIRNGFNMREDFDGLYKSRNEVRFAYKVGGNGIGASDCKGFINLGSNINSNEHTTNSPQNSALGLDTQGRGCFKSRLVFWTVILIGTPLLLTIIAISAMFVSSLKREFFSSTETTESFFLEVQLNALSVYANLRADLVAGAISRATSDLYLVTRYTSWLLFGALERTASFTQVKTSAESCKTFKDTTDCPFYQENYFCDCAWNDRSNSCTNYPTDTRAKEDLYFYCEASDRFSNGDRNFTDFPSVSYSPESTVWWDSVKVVPGAEKGALASGYETTYDRIRVTSALPVHHLVYNQDIKKEYFIGSNLAFESDGLFIGFLGCSNMLLGASQWSSTESNGAYKLRPELCPLGKYGYDPRCREWYNTGKRLAEADGSPLYVSPAYIYGDLRIGQTATSPLIDPQTNKHVGQALIDFDSGPILDHLAHKDNQLGEEGFSFLITKSSGADSVIAPGFSWLNETTKPISELVLPHDHNCNETDCKMRIDQFKEIVSSMKNGNGGTKKFNRALWPGNVESLHIAYAPVVVKGFRQIDSSNFSRGVEARNHMIYSLAITKSEGGLLEQFERIEEETNRIIGVAIEILSIIIILSILLAIYIMRIVTLPLMKQMLDLLDVIKMINSHNLYDEPPVVNRSVGSRELITVSETIHALYKVVRCGNWAFFSGDLEKAYAILLDSFRLFRHLDNKEAVGVISNNLGNLLLVAFPAMNDANEERCCGMTKEEVIRKGISFYYDAIQISEQAYDEFFETDGWSPNCIDVHQQLSNRYFNRGMFLLTVKDGHSESKEMEKLGFRDLEVATDLDMEIVDSDFKAGWGHVTCVLKKFEIALAKAKRQVMLQELGYPDNLEAGEILDDAFIMMKREIEKGDDSLLFQTIKPTGRLQEIETELIRYNLWKGEVIIAAQIGIRMLVEDEFTFPKAQELALEALSLYVDLWMDVDDDKRAELNRRLTMSKANNVCMCHDMDKSLMSICHKNQESYANLSGMKLSDRESNERDLLTMEKL